MNLHALTYVTQREAADVVLHWRVLKAAMSRGAKPHRHIGSSSDAGRRPGRLPCVHWSERCSWVPVLHHSQ